MNSDSRFNIKFHIGMIIAEVTDVIIGIVSNLIIQEPFNILSPSTLVLGGILVILIIIHIACSFSQYNSSPKAKSKRLQKAFQKRGGYDVLAEEMINSVRDHDVETFKNIKKMADMVER